MSCLEHLCRGFNKKYRHQGFESLFDIKDSTEYLSPEAPVKRENTHRETYRSAMTFYGLAPWTIFENEDVFAVRLPDEPHPVVVSIMGAGGQERGFLALRGPRAREQMSILALAEPGPDATDELDMLSVTFERLRDVPAELRRWFKRAKIRVKSSAIVPVLLAKRPGRRLRELDRDELDKVRLLLSGIVYSLMDGEMSVSAVRGARGLITLEMDGAPPFPDVRVVETGELPASEPPLPLQFLVDRTRLAALPRIEQAWLVGCPVTPVSIANTDETVRTLVVIDAETGWVIDVTPVTGPKWRYTASSRFFEVMVSGGTTGKGGRPREVFVANETLADSVCPELRALEISCWHEPDVEEPVREVLDSFLEYLDGGPGKDLSALRSAEASDAGREPEDDSDLEGWKEIDRRVVELGRRTAYEHTKASTRLRTRYYGGAQERAAVENSELDEGAESAMLEWVFFDYRKRSKGRTLAEKLLVEQDLPRLERALLEEMMAATTSLYRVQSVRPGHSVTLVDILRGGTVKVTDHMLSLSAEPNRAFSTRVYRAGDYNFISGVGVSLPSHMSDMALGFLESEGLGTTPAAIRKKSHLFGRLWAWALEAPMIPNIVTSEGDPVIVHNGSFKVPDPEGLRHVLDAREDIVQGSARGWLDWIGGSSAVNEGPVVLGRLRLLGDRIEFETYSEPRWARLRRWLEDIEGAELEELERTTLEDMAESPLSRPPGPGLGSLSDEEMSVLRSEAAALVEEMSTRWVDERIPALGGRTPREAVRTVAGRRKVQQLLRTFPEPAVEPGEIMGLSPDTIRQLLGLPEDAEKP